MPVHAVLAVVMLTARTVLRWRHRRAVWTSCGHGWARPLRSRPAANQLQLKLVDLRNLETRTRQRLSVALTICVLSQPEKLRWVQLDRMTHREVDATCGKGEAEQ